jgi:hypothetical protein
MTASELELVEVQLQGEKIVNRMLAGIARRAMLPYVAYEEIFRLFEADEAAIFASWDGKYVRTGATRASLTQPDANAVLREMHGARGFAFGSNVPYARFVGRRRAHRKRISPILIKASEARAVITAEMMKRYILKGAGGL